MGDFFSLGVLLMGPKVLQKKEGLLAGNHPIGRNSRGNDFFKGQTFSPKGAGYNPSSFKMTQNKGSGGN